MSIYQLKTAFQNLLRPLCKSMADKGITANQVTIAAMVLSVVAGLFIAFNPTSSLPLILLPLVLLIRMGLNAIDGMLAREHNMQSNLGAILNELGDVISDTVLYLPLAFVSLFHPYLIVAIVIVALLTEMVGVMAIQIGADRRYDGPMGKSDRAFVLGGLALFVGLGWLSSPNIINIVLSIVLVLSVVTVVNRAYQSLKSGGV
ncbi:MAG: CDP-alcohol phosphatidyltransferase family protein [Cocleimonas sp.]|nr:CDP-alcohol phosphatidyltransferase family protein [Cocleimonas sp.]